MIAQLVEKRTLMDRERSTRAEPVPIGELRVARDQLQSALNNLSEVIENMDRAKLATLTLRWKTRRDSAKDWHLFSLGLDQMFEAQMLRTSAEISGREAKEQARKSRDK